MLTFVASLALLIGAQTDRPIINISKRHVPNCRMARPDLCTAEWISDDPKFKAAIRRFFKGVPGILDYKSDTPAAPLLDTMWGPHGNPDRIAPGIYRFDACLFHACREAESAVIIARGRIAGAGVTGYACGRCKLETHIYVRRGEPLRRIAVSALLEWSRNGKDSRIHLIR